MCQRPKSENGPSRAGRQAGPSLAARVATRTRRRRAVLGQSAASVPSWDCRAVCTAVRGRPTFRCWVSCKPSDRRVALSGVTAGQTQRKQSGQARLVCEALEGNCEAPLWSERWPAFLPKGHGEGRIPWEGSLRGAMPPASNRRLHGCLTSLCRLRAFRVPRARSGAQGLARSPRGCRG